MDMFLSVLSTIHLILAVVLFFNLMIFVHELGHFWAARWRGLYVDRFQIWFGKPWWKKTINGVQWGIGWIPAGGFVSLPQMAPMEAIEGDADTPRDLPPIKPRDKVIVAAAGPLFSLLLAVVFACIVWIVGKPATEFGTTVVGFVPPQSPAAEAGLRVGDRILQVDGTPVDKWVGNMEGVRERIMMGEGDAVVFLVERTGADGQAQTLTIRSGFTNPERNWYQRKALREVGGILPSVPLIVDKVMPNSPAALAGLQHGDRILAVDGGRVYHPAALAEKTAGGQAMKLDVQRAEGVLSCVSVTPAMPANWNAGMKGATPKLGMLWATDFLNTKIENPDPWSQVSMSLRWMGDTLKKVAAPKSDVGVEHLSGPVGIGTHLYAMLTAQDGWRLALWFAVILNVNLAVLNILPLPVVDGGHVVLGTLEGIFRRPVGGRFLEYVQTGFVLLLMAFFLFVTFKDVGDMVPGGESSGEIPKLPAPVFSTRPA